MLIPAGFGRGPIREAAGCVPSRRGVRGVRNCAIFCASGSSGYNDHNNLDHDYIMTGYLDIDIKNNVYNN
jgi:hypothetical protein